MPSNNGQKWIRKVQTQLYVTPGNIEEEEKDEGAPEEELQIEIPAEVLHSGNCAEDIAQVCALGFIVDDNNEPAPENIPAVQVNKTIKLLLRECGDAVGLTIEKRQIDSVVVHASPVFLELHCKGLRC
jgi:hypothetical protein